MGSPRQGAKLGSAGVGTGAEGEGHSTPTRKQDRVRRTAGVPPALACQPREGTAMGGRCVSGGAHMHTHTGSGHAHRCTCEQAHVGTHAGEHVCKPTCIPTCLCSRTHPCTPMHAPGHAGRAGFWDKQDSVAQFWLNGGQSPGEDACRDSGEQGWGLPSVGGEAARGPEGRGLSPEKPPQEEASSQEGSSL